MVNSNIKALTVFNLTPQTAVTTDVASSTNTLNATSSAINYKSVSYGNGVYVALGSGGKVATSTDGLTWTAYQQLTQANLYSMIIANGLILITSDSATVFPLETTKDSRVRGFQNIAPALADVSLLSSAYGNGLFIVGGNDGSILRNSESDWNNPTWYRATKFPGISMNGFSYDEANKQFLAAGTGGNVLSSADGVHWNKPVVASSANLYAITQHSPSTFFVAGGDKGYSSILLSNNLNNWIASASNSSNQLNDIKCFQNACFAVGNNQTVVTMIGSNDWANIIKSPLSQTTFRGTSTAVPPSLMTIKRTIPINLDLGMGLARKVTFAGIKQTQSKHPITLIPQAKKRLKPFKLMINSIRSPAIVTIKP